jgi:hypothetical protein
MAQIWAEGGQEQSLPKVCILFFFTVSLVRSRIYSHYNCMLAITQLSSYRIYMLIKSK